MILCIDIGNTSISLGIFDKQKLILRFNIPANTANHKNKLIALIKKNTRGKNIEHAVICSVVPKTTKILKEALVKKFGFKCAEIGKQIKAPIKNLYSVPEKVGQDRLVNATAAVRLYGAPAVVVDFGTCITFDCISKKGAYLGGLIIPGIEITLNTLYQKTALLPKIKMLHPEKLIGTGTEESIRSGLYYGFSGACREILQETKKVLGEKTKVIGTGGFLDLFKSRINLIDISDANLTLQGLFIIYNENSQK